MINILTTITIRILSQSINSYHQIHHGLITMCDGICGYSNEISLAQLTAYLDVGSDVLLSMFGGIIAHPYFLGFLSCPAKISSDRIF